MAGPLLLALGAPLTVALRALPRSPRRRLVRVLRSAPVRLLVRAPAVAVLAVAGTAVAWLVPLPHAWHGVWHAHMVVTGFLLAAVVAGVDPVRRDLSVPARLAGVVATGAGHDLVARLAWARAGSGSGRAGAELLATGGHLVDAALAVVVLAGWYRREGRRQAAVRRRTAA
jgi:cytochrome c oxidase assembly factor CtaG